MPLDKIDGLRLQVADPVRGLVLRGEGEVVAGDRLQVRGRRRGAGADPRLQAGERLGQRDGELVRVAR